jgi:hypothetical protein
MRRGVRHINGLEAANKPMNKRKKHKLEKIRRKYKDQDEDERFMKMQLLGHNKGWCLLSCSPHHIVVNGIIEENKLESEDAATPVLEERKPPKTVTQKETPEEAAEEAEEIDDNFADNNQDEDAMISSITSSPLAEDALLFALPMCGPYSAMQRFKFKVKVMGLCWN